MQLKSIGALFLAELKEQFGDTAYSLWTLVLPLLITGAVSLIAGRSQGDEALTMWALIAGTSISLSSLISIPLLRQQRLDAGMYQRLKASPISPSELSIASVLANAMQTFPATILALATAWWLGIRPNLHVALMALWLVSIWIGTLGIGSILGKLTGSFITIKSLGNMIWMYGVACSGIFFDFSQSFPMALIHYANPMWWWLQWGKSAMSLSIITWQELWAVPGILILFGIIAILVNPRKGSIVQATRRSKEKQEEITNDVGLEDIALLGPVRSLWRAAGFTLKKEPIMPIFELSIQPAGILVLLLANNWISNIPLILFVGIFSGSAVAVAWELSKLRESKVMKKLLCSPMATHTMLIGILGVPILMVASGTLLSLLMLVLTGHGELIVISLIVSILGMIGGIGLGLGSQVLIKKPVVLITWIPFLTIFLLLWPLIVDRVKLAAWVLLINPVSTIQAFLNGSTIINSLLAITWMCTLFLIGCILARFDLRPRNFLSK